jgi:hypothetical protein
MLRGSMLEGEGRWREGMMVGKARARKLGKDADEGAEQGGTY